MTTAQSSDSVPKQSPRWTRHTNSLAKEGGVLKKVTLFFTKNIGSQNVHEPWIGAKDGTNIAKIAGHPSVHNNCHHVNNANVEHDFVAMVVVHMLSN
jgi:hypothetical protein